MTPFIYKTRKDKKVNIYIKEDKSIWIDYNDLKVLFNATYDVIDNIINENEKEQKDNESQNIIEQDGIKYISLLYALLIGIKTDTSEALKFLEWTDFFTKEYSSNTSKEFNNNLQKIFDIDQNQKE